jgi:mRNA-degrading endonuclease RelE of RelBE toxin-antitoxin system
MRISLLLNAMTYTLNMDKPALALFKKLPKPIQRLLIEKAQILTTNPHAGASLKGKYRLLRSLHLSVHGTAYRIIYQVFQQSETIVIRLAATRENIYRKLDEMKVKP